MIFGSYADEEASLSPVIFTEVQMFFSERPAPSKTGPLTSWKLNESRYSQLPKLAPRRQCITATAVRRVDILQLWSSSFQLNEALSTTTADIIFPAKKTVIRSARSVVHNPASRKDVPTAARTSADAEEESIPELPDLL